MKTDLTYVKIPKIMGILNVTSDSFSDGNKYLDADSAFEHGCSMIMQGAEIIDIGAESTRPGSIPVTAEVELHRILPILMRLKNRFPETKFSIDTQKAVVAQEAIYAGADIINDISALRFDSKMAEIIAANPKIQLVLMHMQGNPGNMQINPEYDNVVNDIADFFGQRIDFCVTSGIKRENLILDPGIGFGKTLEHNLLLLSNLDRFKQFGVELLLGASRKSFIDKIEPAEPESRIEGSLAAGVAAMLSGVDIIRVHDVLSHKRFFKVLRAIALAGVV